MGISKFIHESLGGGFLGALAIFGAVYVGILGGAATACVALAKVLPGLLAKKPAPQTSAPAGGAS